MVFSYVRRLCKQLSRSKWIQFYFALVVFQTILSIPILVKTLINTEYVNGYTTDTVLLPDNSNTIFGNHFISKGYKIIYENVLFIVYELWRIWILIDGIVHLNSLTIIASAWFSIFSCIFNVMLVVESEKWALLYYEPLKAENMKLQIALTVIFFCLSVPVIITAYKSSKIIGWQVYKKIGSSITLQKMYNKVQWFALLLKVDIFFQLILLIGAAIITERLPFRIVSIVMAGFVFCTMVLSRIAITRESHWMMTVFIVVQILLLACDIYTLLGLFQYAAIDLWFAGIVYVLASIVCVAVNVYLAIRCQMNFGKGLKPFVQWYPLQGKKTDDNEQILAARVGLLGAKSNERLPIDDEDEENNEYPAKLNDEYNKETFIEPMNTFYDPRRKQHYYETTFTPLYELQPVDIPSRPSTTSTNGTLVINELTEYQHYILRPIESSHTQETKPTYHT